MMVLGSVKLLCIIKGLGESCCLHIQRLLNQGRREHIRARVKKVFDMICYDMVWYSKVWYGTVWYDMIYDMIWYMIWYDMVWYDMIWYDMIWYDMIWYDIWYDMIYGMIWYNIWYIILYIWYDMIHLLTAVGLSPGGSSTVHIYTHTIHRTTEIITPPLPRQGWTG
jgi:hypothetical protein